MEDKVSKFIKNLTKENLKVYHEYRRELRENGEVKNIDEVRSMYQNLIAEVNLSIPFDAFRNMLDTEIINRYFEEK